MIKENGNRKIIKNVHLLVDSKIIKNACIVYKDGMIQYADVMKDFAAEEFDEIIEGREMLAMPGLVNAHTHSAMTLLRNYADDLNFEDWLFKNILPTEAKIIGDDIYWGANLAVAEMLSSGTTCFLDMYMSMDKIAQVVADSGIRANLSKDILKASITGDGISVNRSGFEDFHKTWNNSADGRIKMSMEVHSVYLYDEKSLRYAAEVAKEMNVPVHIHILESALERGFSIDKYNLSPLEACLKFGILEANVLAAHCVHLDDWDRNIMKEKKVSALHNPTSNLKLGNGVADVLKMQQAGINVCLGTDGCASNNNLNMFEEMHIAALIHKGMQKKPDIIKADYVLEMATINGAKALGFENLGELKEGMLADIILIDLDKSHIQPIRNEMNALVYSAQGSDVDTVIVNGKTLISKGEHLTLDLEKIKFECKKIAGRLEK